MKYSLPVVIIYIVVAKLLGYSYGDMIGGAVLWILALVLKKEFKD